MREVGKGGTEWNGAITALRKACEGGTKGGEQ